MIPLVGQGRGACSESLMSLALRPSRVCRRLRAAHTVHITPPIIASSGTQTKAARPIDATVVADSTSAANSPTAQAVPRETVSDRAGGDDSRRGSGVTMSRGRQSSRPPRRTSQPPAPIPLSSNPAFVEGILVLTGGSQVSRAGRQMAPDRGAFATLCSCMGGSRARASTFP